MTDVISRLDSARKELELVDKNFRENQKKLTDEYEKEKQVIIQAKQNLEKQIEGLDIDRSADDRRSACENLVAAVKAFLQRTTS